MTRPYVGLRPFRPDEQALFFGRSAGLRALRNLIETLPSVVVYATSGTGKSSLLNAGLLAEIGREHTDTAVATGERRTVAVAISDPSVDLRETVRAALASDADDGASLDELVMTHWAEREERVVLVLDQFEERLKADADTGRLWDELAPLANGDGRSSCLVISIRDDYLAGLEPLLSRVPGLLDASYRVPNLSEDGFREAARRPLAAIGADVTISDALIDEVLSDLRTELRPAEGWVHHVEPGYFQLVCDFLWTDAEEHGRTALSTEAYREAGGATGIIQRFVEETIAHLLPFEQEMLHAIIRYLILPTGAKVALTTDDLLGLIRIEDLTAVALITPLVVEDDDDHLGDQPRAVRRSRRELANSLQFDLDLCRDVIAGLFETMTTSDRPIFRRVSRGQRTEFELVHDLLGFVLLAWRDDFNRRQAALRQSWPAERTPFEATDGAGDLDPVEVAQASLDYVDQEFQEAFGVGLGEAREIGPADVEAAAWWLQAVRGVASSMREVRLDRPATRSERLREDRMLVKWRPDLSRITRAARQVRVDAIAAADRAARSDPDLEVRRAAQTALPQLRSMPHEILGLGYRDESDARSSPRAAVLAAVLALALAAFSTSVVFGTAWTITWLFDPPKIEYLGLSLSLIAAFIAVPVAIVGAVRLLSPRSRLANPRPNLDPQAQTDESTGDPSVSASAVQRRHRRHRLRYAAGLAAICLPALTILVPAYLGAWAFDALGWAATAGFNLVALFACIPGLMTLVLCTDVLPPMSNQELRTAARASQQNPTPTGAQ